MLDPGPTFKKESQLCVVKALGISIQIRQFGTGKHQKPLVFAFFAHQSRVRWGREWRDHPPSSHRKLNSLQSQKDQPSSK